MSDTTITNSVNVYPKIPVKYRVDLADFESSEAHKFATQSKMRKSRVTPLPGWDNELEVHYRNVSSFTLSDLREAIEDQLEADGYKPEVPILSVELGGLSTDMPNPDDPEYQVALKLYDNRVTELVNGYTAQFIFLRGIIDIVSLDGTIDWRQEVLWYKEENAYNVDLEKIADVFIFLVYVAGLTAQQLEELAILIMSGRSVEQAQASFRDQANVQGNVNGSEGLTQEAGIGLGE